LPRFARNYRKNRKKSSGFPASDRICLASGIRPFTNKFSFARMLSVTDLVGFAAFFNKLAQERDFENAELSGGESLGSHRGSAPHVSFGLLVIAMQDAAGSLFDDLDAAFQSGLSEKRVRTAQRLGIESSEGFG
jgi:hypothetical protein